MVLILTTASQSSADEITCGSLANAFGPFDYRNAQPPDLKIVEDFHFTQDVASLKHAAASGTIGSDLDYTLRAFPNHYRALVAMMNLQFKTKTDRPVGAHWSVPCYFDRAIRFQPDDGTVRTVFGVYLMRIGKASQAVQEFEKALSLGDDTGNLHYNLGLAYFNLGEYDKSIAHAKRAYDLGFNLPGLRENLRKAGKWPSKE